MEEISASIIPKEEEDDDLLVYCMREGAKDILSKGKDEVYLLLQFDRKILMDSEIKFGAFFRVSTYFSSLLIFHLILLYISCHIYKKELIPKKKNTKHNNKYQLLYLVVTRLLRVAQKSKFGCRCRTTQGKPAQCSCVHTSKLQLWDLLSASRSRKRHYMVV